MATKSPTTPATAETSAPSAAPAPAAFDPRPIRNAAGRWKRIYEDQLRYPKLEVDCRAEEQRLEAQLAKLGVDHLRPEATPATENEDVAMMASHLQTIRTKLRMIPISRKQNEGALAQLGGQIGILADGIIAEQLAEARRRVNYARTELRRVLFEIYGKDVVKTERAADSLLESHRLPMVNQIFPKAEPVRWLQYWRDDARMAHPCNCADYVSNLLDTVTRFQAGQPVTAAIAAAQSGGETPLPSAM